MPTVHVFGRKLPATQITQIHLWRRVVFHNFDSAFPNVMITDGSDCSKKEPSRLGGSWDARGLVLGRIVADFGPAIAVRPGYVFSESFVYDVSGYTASGHVVIKDKGLVVLEAISGKKEASTEPLVMEISDSPLQKMDAKDISKCHILLRSEFAHMALLQAPMDIAPEVIVLGVASTSRRTKSIDEHPLFTILLPSLVETCAANASQHFLLFVGYDEGDKYLDSAEHAGRIRDFFAAFQRSNLHIKLVRLPETGAVTLVWNYLYELSMRSGAKYFYQINDDLTFKNSTWPFVFKKALDAQSGRGVVGPSDHHFGCKLMTQNFVGRGHWEAFGFLFPPELRNWWCDNWINALYSRVGLRKCFADIGALNGGRKDGCRPRYVPCSNYDYMPLMFKHLADMELLLSVNSVL